MSDLPRYVLITPARNEEAFIEGTIRSVAAQTVRPVRWVIVNDGSTDGTRDIVMSYMKRFPWMHLVDLTERGERSFADKARAFHTGLQHMEATHFEILGNLDADISFEADYFEFLLARFAENPRLGVAGTTMREPRFDALRDSFFNESDVAGNCQLFRRGCFDDIGGYTPSPFGGIDWIAVRTARLKGWKTRSFTEKSFLHHRPMGTAQGGILKARFDYGRKDYFLGNHPVWQVFRVAYQTLKWPYAIGGLALLSGYLYALACRIERPISAELLRFHRREQLVRLRNLALQFVRTGRLQLRSSG